MTTIQPQRIEGSSGALPSDGLSRFIGAGAWVAIASGLAMAAPARDLGGGPWLARTEDGAIEYLVLTIYDRVSRTAVATERDSPT